MDNTLSQCAGKILDIIEQSGIEGLAADAVPRGRHDATTFDKISDWRHTIWANFDQGWALNASISVKLYLEDGMPCVEPSVNWGTSTYTLDQAEKAAKLHVDIVALARRIQKVGTWGT